jgi:hypothetical protein
MLRQKGCSSVPTLFPSDSISKRTRPVLPPRQTRLSTGWNSPTSLTDNSTSGRHQPIRPHTSFAPLVTPYGVWKDEMLLQLDCLAIFAEIRSTALMLRKYPVSGIMAVRSCAKWSLAIPQHRRSSWCEETPDVQAAYHSNYTHGRGVESKAC